MKRRLLNIAVVLFSSLTYSNNDIAVAKTQKEPQEQIDKSKYEERKEWIKNRKNSLIQLINELVNMNDLLGFFLNLV